MAFRFHYRSTAIGVIAGIVFTIGTAAIFDHYDPLPPCSAQMSNTFRLK